MMSLSACFNETTLGGIVIGGDYQGLAIARSLGRHHVPVCVIDDEYSIARFSKYVNHSIRVPNLRDDPLVIKTLLDTGHQLNLRGWVLYPTRDETVAALSRYKFELEKFFRVPTPDWSTIQWACDKRNTYHLAELLGIPTPRSCYLTTLADFSDQDIPFPVAIKPAIKEHFFYAVKAKAWRANNRSELQTLFARASQQIGTEEVIIQELIPGDGSQQFAYCAFFKDGSARAKMVVRRARQHPSEFGRASTFVITTEIPLLEELSERLLRAINYYGLVEMEYKRDPRDGKYKLLDFNARTWGYHSLGYSAGVDFPYLLYADQFNLPVRQTHAKAGISWVRLVTDLPAALLEFQKRKIRSLEYINSLRSADIEAVFSCDDWLPGMMELFLLPYLAIRRGF